MWRNKRLLLVASLILLLLSVWAFMVWRKAEATANLTPELVVSAFQDAGLEVDNAQYMTSYPGAILPGEYGISFSTRVYGETCNVYIVSYAGNGQAKESVSEINGLDSRMGGYYADAFRRGSIILVVSSQNEEIARRLNRVFQAIR